jgi:hypothetical protein
VDLVAPGYPVLSTVSVADGSYEWYYLKRVGLVRSHYKALAVM